MKWVTASVLASVVSAPGVAQDVSIALGINQPGLYGQVIIGNAPRPPVLYAQPIVVQPVPQYADAEPIRQRLRAKTASWRGTRTWPR